MRCMWLGMGVIVVLGALGCRPDIQRVPPGEEDEGRPPPPGGDSFDPGMSSADGGPPPPTPPTGLQCGSATCADRELVGIALPACCSEREVCGNDYVHVNAAVPTFPVQGCAESARRGSPNPDVCGEAFDAVDGRTDGLASIHLGESDDGQDEFILAAPCCTPEGLCGAVLDRLDVAGAGFDLDLGCQPYTELGRLFAGTDEGAALRGEWPLPFCDPAAAERRTCVADQEIVPGFALEDWQCATLGLPAPGGQEYLIERCIEGLPASTCGCGRDVDEAPDSDSDGVPDCLPHIVAKVCGCG